jgi:hypothetical protein
MAGPFPSSDFQVELSTDDAAYTTYDAHAISVTPGGGERARGTVHVAGRDVPYITHGKRSAMEYTVRVLYTTAGADLYVNARARYLAKTTTYLRYSPEGGGQGDKRVTVGPGTIESCPPPQGDAGSGDPMALEFLLVGEDEADSVVP